MKTSIYALTAVLAGTLALSAAANAEGYKAKAGAEANISSEKFAALDADKSGALNEAELAKYNAAISFDSADADNDGRLTLSELRLNAKSPAATTESEASVGTSANTVNGTDGTGTPVVETPDASGSGTGGRQ